MLFLTTFCFCWLITSNEFYSSTQDVLMCNSRVLYVEFIEQGLVRKMRLATSYWFVLKVGLFWTLLLLRQLERITITICHSTYHYLFYNYASTYTPHTQPSQTQLILYNCLSISDSLFIKLAAILLSEKQSLGKSQHTETKNNTG